MKILKIVAVTLLSFFGITESTNIGTPLAANQQISPEIEDLKSKVKFIAGLIAMHRPNIKDCGLIAKDIVEVSFKENVDPFYLAAVVSVESRFSENSLSSANAHGLMQLLPSTAHEINNKNGEATKFSDIQENKSNLTLGIKYLKRLERRYKGDKTLALAAYNWGPKKVDRVNKDFEKLPSGVKNYTKMVLERNENWANHFQKAESSALAFAINS